ncbi:methyltransferase [Nocardia seriolae]|uniref:Hydroxyneurosporene methyltransferase n=1 Tax=Nocardia seriolae TaxID=37332 RepID=A0ABC8B351_9NOCA|nr:methyltransferase [Nocardia seriolae]APB00884.1 Tetracenomycin F2 synthase [Nocardia seriolae]OJF84735.1 hydroxyneurosporene methyltransferase [Nocardia seriolae]PSK32086.1 hydroxyneurosporene methyltransferase [Nocardia seriolae]QOW33726.1 hydroxyneurosporene methyltransferase [Nocardia seriolae]QUN14845.1 hydroxyneurosporene methyltransferase [Nocardia seriolae]
MASAAPKAPPLPLLRALAWFRDGLAALHRRLVPGHIALLELSTAGYLTQAACAAAELGIADALASGPKQPGELARAVGADEAALRRLMRLLISAGVFAQRRDGSYRLTGISRGLRSDAAVSLRDLFLLLGSDLHRQSWTHLTDSVRQGRSLWPELRGMEFFDYAEQHPEIGAVFDRAMTSVTSLATEPLQAAYDFGHFGSIVDVGGGRGSLLVDVLRRHPSMRGTVFDLPRVIEGLLEELLGPGLTGRLTFEGGSFFDTVPKGGDAYLLKHIVHDWGDEDAERILRTVRTAMESEARLLIIDTVMPDHHRSHPGKVIDLEMLINTRGGRERTLTEFGNLLSRSGFTLARVVPTAAPYSVLEAHPAW